jgi:hypothetical protein
MRAKIIKDLVDVSPAWANGCQDCTYGIKSAPVLTGVVETHLERLVQARRNELVLCTCRAGVARMRNMQKSYAHYIKETNTRTLFAAFPKDTHVDFLNAEHLIDQARKAVNHE